MDGSVRFAYGFFLLGISLPYLIEHYFGPTAGTACAAIVLLLGVGFIVSGHRHPLAVGGPVGTQIKQDASEDKMGCLSGLVFISLIMFVLSPHGQRLLHHARMWLSAVWN
jgi:hypothetical protein